MPSTLCLTLTASKRRRLAATERAVELVGRALREGVIASLVGGLMATWLSAWLQECRADALLTPWTWTCTKSAVSSSSRIPQIRR
jgi:hypothetical protein